MELFIYLAGGVVAVVVGRGLYLKATGGTFFGKCDGDAPKFVAVSNLDSATKLPLEEALTALEIYDFKGREVPEPLEGD